jgi:hypothetical protein
MSKVYKVPCVWQMWGMYEVEAESLGQAIEQAMELPLPDTQDYLSDSFEIDADGLRVFNPELGEDEFEDV